MSKKRKQVIDDDLVVLEEENNVFAESENQEIVEQTEVENKPSKEEKAMEENLKREKQKFQADQKKKLDEAEQAVSKQSSKKKKILNWVFFAINIVVVIAILVIQLNGEGGVTSPQGLTFYGWPFLVLLIVFGANIFFDTFAVSYLMKKSTGKWRFGLSYKTNAIGRYYDYVTPLAAGGQPFQITYLKSHDIPIHSAMSIPLAKMVFQQLGWIVMSFICMIVSFTSSKYNTFVSVTSVIGFVLGSFMLFLIVFLSISKNWGRKLVVMVLKLLQKMRILKSYEKQYEKIMKVIEDYQSVMRQYAKSPKDFLILFFSYMLRLFMIYMIPYLVFSMYKGFDPSLFFDFYVMTVLIDLASSFFPLPGGTGMSELTFSAMFGSYFAGGTLFWALITWRLFSFYYYLLQGIAIICYDQFYGNRKYRWLQRKETLVEESVIFKQEQINRFRAERSKMRRQAKKK